HDQSTVEQVPDNTTPVQNLEPVSNTDELPQQNEQSGNTEQLESTNETIELDPAIPQSLRDLMQQHNVTEVEIKHVVSSKGYYPFETPITNYDPSFIEGVLVGAWEQVHQEIKTTKEQI